MGLSVQTAVGHALIFKGWQVSGWAERGGGEDSRKGRGLEKLPVLCRAERGENLPGQSRPCVRSGGGSAGRLRLPI